jgi:hypothetical protein
MEQLLINLIAGALGGVGAGKSSPTFDLVRASEKRSGTNGGRTRTRTWDPLIKSQLLYQLSYAPGPPTRGTRGGRVL